MTRARARATTPAALRATLAASLCVFASVSLPGCHKDDAEARALTGGDPHKGKLAIRHYGCSSCHTIPGIHEADALVGPPLAGVAARSYLGGVLVNTPSNLIRWIQDPPAVDPKTAMPNVRVTESDARDIAAYLYALR
jgi:cytochrome c